MISKFHFSAAALGGVLACSVAGAQVRDGSSSRPAAVRACEGCREGIGKLDGHAQRPHPCSNQARKPA